MIVFITGPFGVGKTSAARALVELAPGAILYDPERVGALVRELLAPVDPRGDFQEYAVWRRLVVDVVRRLRETYQQPVVMPMTVLRRDFYDELTAGLRAVDPALVRVRLTASRETLTARILGRPDAEGSHAWCLSHLNRGLTAAADPHFGTEISTEGLSAEEVARAILLLDGWRYTP